ncbi:MAG: TRAP transporter substrate-binding protein DctP [Desulfobacterales bacterium]|nr:TRAP transporter substrate-binding protein DctP [Desulfobacterales bacterium]
MAIRLSKKILLLFLVAGLCIGLSQPARAKRPGYLFKVASLAPDGSVWATHFREFADRVSNRTNGEVGFKIYSGGVMGDDRSMYRKMRVGQIHGGGFTMTGIGEVVPDFRVLGIPFLFNSYQEVDRVVERLWPRLKQKFADQGLELMALSEVGFVYTMSSLPIRGLDDLRQSKCWVPSGDPISMAFLQTARVTPVPLPIQDVLTSLQTGMINTTFNSFYGAIILQWYPTIKYITDIPFAYAYGAFVLDQRKLAALPLQYRTIMAEEARTTFARMLVQTRQDNVESLQVLQKSGIRLVQPLPETGPELERYRQQTVDAIIGTAFSREIYRELIGYLSEYRRQAGTGPPGGAAGPGTE